MDKKKIRLEIEIPVEAFIRGWAGMGRIKITPVESRGPRKILGRKREEKQPPLTEDECTILSAWNELSRPLSPKETRNQQQEDSAAFRKGLRIALLSFSHTEIIERIYIYLDVCRGGRHLWGSPVMNHGYKNLESFLKAILKAQKEGKKLWWEREDPQPIRDENPELTGKLIASYGPLVSGKTLELSNPSYEYRNFVIAAKRLKVYIGKVPTDEDELVGIVFRALIDYAAPGLVRFGMLSSSQFWSSYFVQYLQKLFPGSRF